MITPVEREELDLLIPWYVNGTLTPDESARVEAAARADASFRRALDVALEDREQVYAEANALGKPGSRVLERILAETSRSARAAPTTLAQRFREIVTALSPRSLAMAGMAAAVLIVAQGATLGWMATGWNETPAIELASGGQERTDMAFIFAVRFADGAQLAGIVALLENQDLTIVDGPLAGKLFVVGRPKDSASTSPADETLKSLLAAQTLVQFASPLAIEEN